MIKVGLISLGCAKNLVDSEVMLGLLGESGCELTPDASSADVLIVNTCAFIGDAVSESAQTIREMSEIKRSGPARKLIVTGCFPQRYRSALERDFPEVDHFLGTGEVGRIVSYVLGDAAQRVVVTRPDYLYDDLTPRISTLPPHTAYVKVSEGCSRACSFCIIPRLRGAARSRPPASIVAEVSRLAAAGAVEINLIAQDLTAYGLDLGDGTTLQGLLRELVKVRGLRWIRLLYNHPANFPSGLMDLIASEEKVAKYVDLPLQHIDDRILSAMRRETDEVQIRTLIDNLRLKIPGVVLRTTLITGFPGETQAQFRKLRAFVEETEFDRLGVFAYSREDGTPASRLPRQVPAEVAEERRAAIMAVQRGISARKNSLMLGRTVEVLIDVAGGAPEPFTHSGRTQGQALEVDGSTFLRGDVPAPGSIVEALVEGASDYDLFTRVIAP